jgi:hypothetical protein
MPLHNAPTINSVSIPLLLEWWQHRKRVASVRSNLHGTLPKGDDAYLQAYYRLMEVYSVVKSGGVKAQTEAVHAFATRESLLLKQRLAELDAANALSDAEKQLAREKIEQELSELRSANDWRLRALSNIAPDEESTVKRYLSEIERTLMQQAQNAWNERLGRTLRPSA